MRFIIPGFFFAALFLNQNSFANEGSNHTGVPGGSAADLLKRKPNEQEKFKPASEGAGNSTTCTDQNRTVLKKGDPNFQACLNANHPLNQSPNKNVIPTISTKTTTPFTP